MRHKIRLRSSLLQFGHKMWLETWNSLLLESRGGMVTSAGTLQAQAIKACHMIDKPGQTKTPSLLCGSDLHLNKAHPTAVRLSA